MHMAWHSSFLAHPSQLSLYLLAIRHTRNPFADNNIIDLATDYKENSIMTLTRRLRGLSIFLPVMSKIISSKRSGPIVDDQVRLSLAL